MDFRFVSHSLLCNISSIIVSSVECSLSSLLKVTDCITVCAPGSVGVGASGALYGLLGMQAAFVVMNWKEMPAIMKCQSVCWLSFALVSTALLALYPQVDIYAHVGGFVTGVLIGSFFVKQGYPAKWSDMSACGRVAIIIVSVLLAFMYIGMLGLFYGLRRGL